MITLGQLRKITTRLCKVVLKNSQILKDDKIVYNYFFVMQPESFVGKVCPKNVDVNHFFLPKEKEKIKAESGVSMSKTEEKKEEGKTRRILGTFHLPLLSLELRRDALNADMEPGIVSLTFTDFGVEFEKVETFSSRTEISLKGLIMEDLLLDDLSPHRILMVSSGLKPSQYSEKKTGVSTSCPNLARNRHDKDIKSKSLPGSLDPKFIFGGRPGTLRHSDVRRMTRAAAPDTPPPSACSSPEDSSQRLYNEVRSGENLVNVSITNIDPNHPELESGMRNITRHVMVDFNSLDINFNLETWVVVLNFFGIGSGGDTVEPSRYNNENNPLSISSLIYF